MHLLKYNDVYKLNLYELLQEYSLEANEFRSAPLIDRFTDYYQYIYLFEDKGELIGFTTFTVNTYFGLREPTLANDFLYVRESNRGYKASVIHLIQIFKLVEELDINLVCPLLEDSPSYNFEFNNIQQKPIYKAVEYSKADINKQYIKHKRRKHYD